MSFDFVSPWMLAGLAGVALPFLAHLLSRRKFDVVQWGAMQFLELGREARRKLRLEQILLMLLRMGLIALLALAMARPWAQGGFLANFVSTQPRDVVLVVDGSYSMGYEGKAVTPHAAAIEWAHKFLEDLRPGDTVSLIDARDRPRAVIESPSRDFGFVREQLNELPSPSGSSNLAEATALAVQLLSRTSNLSREVIVLSDGQARAWRAEDENLWLRIDDLRKQPSVSPRLWAVDATGDDGGARVNFSVDRLELSRALTVPGFPLRVRTKVRGTGADAAVTRRVWLEVDGQRLSETTLQVQVPPGGEVPVEFEHRFRSVGSPVVSVVLDEDALSGDNRADAAVSVAEAIPVLLVEGNPQLDATRRETFFAAAALSASSNETPWVRATVAPWDGWSADDLDEPEVVVLANVPRLSAEQAAALKAFAARGGGVLIAAGDLVDAASYNELLFEKGAGLLPGELSSIQKDDPGDQLVVRVVDESLELPWMAAFRAEHGGGLTESRFTSWWKIEPAAATDGEGDDGDASKSQRAAVTAARLDTSDPLLVVRRYGRGSVMLLACPLDADWSTLPAKQDFVPLLHEMVFQLASGRAVRNVEAGEPLVLPVPAEFPFREYAFYGPEGAEFAVTIGEAEVGGASEESGGLRPPLALGQVARLDDTRLPGVYALRRKDGDAGKAVEQFVVNFDRGESDLTPLDDGQRGLLTADGRMAFIESHDELRREMLTDTSRTELWYLLLLVFVAMMVGELVMTRRLVRGGHAADLEAADEPEALEPQTSEEREWNAAVRG